MDRRIPSDKRTRMARHWIRNNELTLNRQQVESFAVLSLIVAQEQSYGRIISVEYVPCTQIRIER